MRIAVYSGSFDPLHVGHQAIMEYLTRDENFDWVYLVISPQNPFKDPRKALNAQQRYRDAIAAVRRHPELRVWVDDIELGMPQPNYTVLTLDALRKREPGNEFSLVIGADNLAEIELWRESSRLLSEYELLVYPREGSDPQSVRAALLEKNPSFRIRLLDAPVVDISSTEIRERQALGMDVSALLM